jgi:hypothetical protein
VPHKLFRFNGGYQPPSLNGTFKRLMRDTGLLKNEDGQNGTLYSLRHTYASLNFCVVPLTYTRYQNRWATPGQ